MTRREINAHAWQCASGLIDAMDLEQFFGEDIYMSEDDEALRLAKQRVIDRIRRLARPKP